MAADSVPAALVVSAWTDDGTVMGLRHREHPATEGVQFHPESILTTGGHDLVANWLRTVDWWRAARPGDVVTARLADDDRHRQLVA